MTVPTTSGRLHPIERDGLVIARGVRYARADRFAPVAPAPGDADADATVRGPACPQDPSEPLSVTGPIADALRKDEHCQVLTVTAPAQAAGLPVMVFFHGGSYLHGGGESPKYDMDSLARAGVVAVSVTYRLGILGYLPPDGGTNLGFSDQLEALRWVRDNIAAFGGDPARVTIFGQSAGGDSVIALAATPAARGLFHRAVVQSAPLGLRKDKSFVIERVRRHLVASLPDLRSASYETILAAQRRANAFAGRFGPTVGTAVFVPILDDPDGVGLAGLLARVAPDVELLIGWVREDAAPFVADSPAALLERLGSRGRRVQAWLTSWFTEHLFAEPARRLARHWRASGGRAATYRFDWAPDGGPWGACHCMELPCLFDGDWSDAPMLAGQPVPPELAAEVKAAWVAFARDGVAGLARRDLRFDVRATMDR